MKRSFAAGKGRKNAGIELFVMDDGWFLGRNDDTSSLGDWEPTRKNCPEGLPLSVKNKGTWHGFRHLGGAGDDQ